MATKNGRPSLRDIAARVGVSETAASFALNGQPGVSAATRKRVLDVVAEMGWRPSHAARVLSGARSRTIGFVLPQNAARTDADQFFMRLMMGIQSVLGQEQYGLLVQVAESPEAELETYRDWAAERRVDGVVLVDLREDDSRPAVIEELGLPAVLAGGPDPSGHVRSVSIDDAVAMDLALAHVRDLGHERIAYLSGPRELLHIRQRIEAFTRSVDQQGLGHARVVSSEYDAVSAARATARLMEGAEAPTAFICDNEVLAVSAVATLRGLGIAVPDQVSVISCEDTPVCEAMQPSLTALHRDTHGFGADVARYLLRLLDGEEVPNEQEQAPTLVVRGSTVVPR